MLKTVEIPLGEWLPDSPDYKNPGCITANNAYPTAGGYSPVPGASATGDKLTGEAVQGGTLYFRKDETAVVVGGSSTKLLTLVSGALTETTGLTAIGADQYWDFAQFNARVVAVAPSNTPRQLTDIESVTSWTTLTGAPEGKVAGRVGNFLVVGNLTGLSLPYSFQWSAENDPTDWPTPGTNDARLKQSGRAALQPEYGEITGITGDRYPLVFQQRAINRMSPVGPPFVFRRETFEEARGCIAPGSIVTVGFLSYFLAHDGFWATDGNQTLPIGTRRVNEWFFTNVSEKDRFRTHGAVNWREQSIVWTFYKADDPSGFNRQIIYSWAENRWSTGDLSLHYMVPMRTVNSATALETWTLGAFIANGSDSEFNLLTGPSREASFETADFEPVPGRRVSVNALYPIAEAVEPGGIQKEDDSGALLMEDGDQLLREQGRFEAALVTRARPGGTETTSTQSVQNDAGFVPVRGDGRFARAKLVFLRSTEWDKAQGVQVEHRVSGRR